MQDRTHLAVTASGVIAVPCICTRPEPLNQAEGAATQSNTDRTISGCPWLPQFLLWLKSEAAGGTPCPIRKYADLVADEVSSDGSKRSWLLHVKIHGAIFGLGLTTSTLSGLNFSLIWLKV